MNALQDRFTAFATDGQGKPIIGETIVTLTAYVYFIPGCSIHLIAANTIILVIQNDLSLQSVPIIDAGKRLWW